MRCAKCGYNQFDNPDTCSKCRADLSEERIRLNLPEGPLNPISLTEILEMVQSGSFKEVPSAGGTTKIQSAKPAEPKSFSVDLGSNIPLEVRADKQQIIPQDLKKKPVEGLSVDLTLE
jgi:hypothetical protein